MDVLNSCSWCGRVEGEVKGYEETGSCFWSNDGLALEVVISWGKGGLQVRVPIWWMGCRGQGGEKDQPGVDEDEGNSGGIEREGSLVDGGSSGEEEGTRSGFVWDKGLGEVGQIWVMGRYEIS